MEESEKRRERLRAMRTEATEAKDCNNFENLAVPHGLSNPLIETSYASPQGHVEPYATPRFDYYTNPASAFSAEKRGSKVSHQDLQQQCYTPPRPRTPQMSSPQTYQAQTNYFPNQRVYQDQGFYNRSGPYRSPGGMGSPFGFQQETPPGVWKGSGGMPNYYIPPNSSRGGNFPTSGFEQRGSPSFNSGQGSRNWFNNSPSPSPGRRGSPGPNSGRGRGGGWSGQGRNYGSGHRSERQSAEDRPDIYYNKSMVEDPWKLLEPVIWKCLNTPDSSNSWLPKFLSAKKARVSEASKESNSQPSLAEYLAASFSDAVNNESVNDEPRP